MEESTFINLLRSAATGDAARGLADDAAVLSLPKDGDLVFTHDMMVEGTHYFPDADPADVAWKLVVRNLSDLAAKGATSLGVLLGYVLGDETWDRRFVEGLHDALLQFGTELWGGDTASIARTAPRVLGMTAIGRASHLPVPSRSGAQPGDGIWIAGTIGDAYLGWRALADRSDPPAFWSPDTTTDPSSRADDAAALQFRDAFNRPVPRLAEGAALAPQVTAMMDISDGPLLDARRMALASGATFCLSPAALPFSAALLAAAVDDPGLLLRAAGFGDDYALLFTLPPDQTPHCAAACIGNVAPKLPDTPLLIDGAPPDKGASLGWQHHG